LSGLVGMKGYKLTKSPNNNGRKTDGTFAPGNALGGKTKGSRNKTTIVLEALLSGDGEAIAQKAIELAKSGDMTAIRLCLERLVPVRKDSPVYFNLPDMNNADDGAKALAGVLRALAAGEITPSEANSVAGVIETYRRTLETAEFENRIATLEKGGSR
jgi:hypothetical protein